jgi:hypothetical protein
VGGPERKVYLVVCHEKLIELVDATYDFNLEILGFILYLLDMFFCFPSLHMSWKISVGDGSVWDVLKPPICNEFPGPKQLTQHLPGSRGKSCGNVPELKSQQLIDFEGPNLVEKTPPSHSFFFGLNASCCWLNHANSKFQCFSDMYHPPKGQNQSNPSRISRNTGSGTLNFFCVVSIPEPGVSPRQTEAVPGSGRGLARTWPRISPLGAAQLYPSQMH